MANPQLSVELTARIDGLRNGVQQAADQIRRFELSSRTALTGLDRNFTALSNSARNSGRSISQSLAAAAAATATSGRAISVGSNQAAFALTNLGRVAQDAPFGFIGIQNNLNPLLESFQRLRAESGSNALAFRALGQSLIGPAGLGLALSLVTAGIVIYQQYQQKANKATNDAKKSTDDYINTLDQVTQARVKGAQNATKEIAELQVLFGAYQNANLPLKARKEAYKEIQQEYPAYFKNIKFEQQASEATKKSYDELTAAIIATGRARAAVELIAKNEIRKLENEQKINDLQKEQLKNQKLGEKALSKPLQIAGSEAEFSARQAASQRFFEAAFKAQVAINNLKTDTNKLDANNLKLVESVNSEVEKGAKIQGGIGSDEGMGKKVKSLSDVLDELRVSLTQNENQFGRTFGEKRLEDIKIYQQAIDELIKLGYNPASDAVKRLADQQQRLVRLQELSASPSAIPSQLKTATKPIEPVLKKTGITFASDDEVKRITDNNKFLESSFSSLASSIGDSLANGASPIAAFGKSVLSVIGDVITRFGALTLAAGVAASSLGKALRNPLNPANATAAIVAGAALIAVGAAVKAFSSGIGKDNGSSGSSRGRSIPQFATGVNNFSGGLALVGERGPELVNLPTGSDVIPNNRSMDIMGRNGATNINLTGGISLGARELVLFIEREKSLMSRSGYSFG